MAVRRARARFRWGAGATAIALWVFFTALYLATRTAYYSVEAVRVAGNILAFHRAHDLIALFHPGYLAFAAIGMLAWKLSLALGYRGGPIPVLETINSLAGGMGIGLLSLLLRAILTRSRALTILIPSALGVSFGYWSAATDARPEMPAIAIATGAAYMLVRAMLWPTMRRTLWAGLATGLACIFSIAALPLVFIGIFGIAMAQYTQGTHAEEQRARLMNILAFVVSSSAILALSYGFVGVTVLRFSSGGDWGAWFSQRFAQDWWFSSHFAANIRLDAYALRRALFVEPGSKTGTFHLDTSDNPAANLLYWASLAAWFVAAYAIVSATAFLVRTHYKPYLLVALAAAIVYAALGTYVNPGDFVNWTPVTVASAVITAIAGSYYRGRRGGMLWLVGLGVWTIIFAASNYEQFIGPHLRLSANPIMLEASEIQARTRPGDVIVVSGLGDDAAIVAYVPYFVHRTVFSLRDSLQAHRGNVPVTARDLQGAAAQAIASGHHVYAFGDIWQDASIRARLRSEFGVRSPQQLFAGLRRAPAWRDPEEPDTIVWKLVLATLTD